MKSQILYNVKIGGFSIGITDKKQEAEGWLSRSMYSGKKEIVTFINQVSMS